MYTFILWGDYMILRLIKRTKIYDFRLPENLNGNFWITDMDGLGNTRNLVSVEPHDGELYLKSNFETKIVSNKTEIDSIVLREHNLYFLKMNNENNFMLLYASPDKEVSVRLEVQNGSKILIGNGPGCAINYSYPLISPKHAALIYQNGSWYLENYSTSYGTYVNNELATKGRIYHGDIIFIMGLKIIPLGDSIIVNNIGSLVRVDNNVFRIKHPKVQPKIDEGNAKEEDIEFYKDEDYFFRSPRFKAGIEPVEITIDPPPAKEEGDQTPLIYTLGPMLSMGMVSLLMGYGSLASMSSGKSNSASLQVTMCVLMLVSMIIWPLLSRRWQKRRVKQKEKLRQTKYKEYIESKRELIHSEMDHEKKVLEENYISLGEAYNIVIEKKRNLWEREIDQSDFLDLRLGLGNKEFSGMVKYPEERFTLQDDNLMELVNELGAESKVLENVPINLSFVENNISAIIGEGKQKNAFIDGLILQLVTFHSYTDLKIVVFTNEKNETRWEYLKTMPHTWNNTRTMRYFSTNNDEAKELSLALEQVYQQRTETDEDSEYTVSDEDKDYKNFSPYYFIIIDDFKQVRELEIIKDVCEANINSGFSIVIINNRLANLPNECHTFISINDEKSGVFENEIVSNKQKEFVADYDLNIDMYQVAKRLANIPIETAKENSELPSMISFLEMYNCGKVEQLDILNRWKNSNPTKTLQAPIGVDKNRELFKLDLHEKAHGPHGLIAGMTGSGKSELIITYILSMALNYSPDEVSFILIDYKGGGLAGAFENKETGLRLPHLAGTITNLDTAEIYRSLASIQSELRRRQKKFNETRDQLNESTIDIYKYQTLYKEGLVKEPIPHLIIVSDEFAELKDQQPDFMDELISTARIGRSLGVHLILATQKPAGVVDDQIWSNSKFRICLKVQDRSDSMDMIKSPVAAALKETGRFYLQVGYNELFAMGQSAWSGAQYYPQEKMQTKIDERVDFIDDVGNVVKSIDSTNRKIKLESKGEEITNIVKYICDEAKQENKYARRLWLPKIPAEIFVEELKKKYNYVPLLHNINPILGEFDDPNNQRQAILTLPLSENGSAIIYGSAGAGKELALTTMIYSIITDHSPDEVNLYIMDFGAETLRNFKDAPQVGDVILQSDEEKVANLLKMLNKILEERKKLFVDYNGNYDFYIKHSGKTLPIIVVVINNYDAFSETYDKYTDDLGVLTREANKYGIEFVVTAGTTTSLRYRIRQNFPQNICLQFNDESDYSAVLGNVHKKYPSRIYGRGIINGDDIYEFQTAYPYESSKMSEYIKVVCKKLGGIFKERAKKIPVLPKNITQETVRNALNNYETVPLGIERDSLRIATVNMLKQKVYTVTGNAVDEYPDFISNLVNTLTMIEGNNVYALDSYDIIYGDYGNATLVNDSFDETLNTIVDKVNKGENVSIVALGLKDILMKVDPAVKTNFTAIVQKIPSLENFRIVLVDNVDKIKDLSFEMWIKDSLDLSNALWLGSGILDQFTLKVSSSPSELRGELNTGLAIELVKGRPIIIKLLEGDIYDG